MLKAFGRRNAYNVQKVLWAVGETNNAINPEAQKLRCVAQLRAGYGERRVYK